MGPAVEERAEERGEKREGEKKEEEEEGKEEVGGMLRSWPEKKGDKKIYEETKDETMSKGNDLNKQHQDIRNKCKTWSYSR